MRNMKGDVASDNDIIHIKKEENGDHGSMKYK